MYMPYEIPQFTVNILYFDNSYKAETAVQVKELLIKHRFFPPTFIHAGRLTQERYTRYKPQMEDYLVRCYTEKDILGFSMGDPETKKAKEFWHMDWGFTFLKQTDHRNNPLQQPWNVLQFQSTYGRLRSVDYRSRFFALAEDAICLLKPFYVKMEDLSVSVELSLLPSGHGVNGFRYGEAKAIYWGNYFGPEYCKKYSLRPEQFPKEISWKPLNDGLLFYLSDSPWDLAKKETQKLREELSRKLGIARPKIKQEELQKIDQLLSAFMNTGNMGPLQSKQNNNQS